MARVPEPMTAKIENFIRMEARGESYDEVLKEIFGLDPKLATKEEKNKASQQMWRWRHRPDAQAIWDDEMKARVRRCVPRAVNLLENQIGSKKEWVANKAANDVVNLAKQTGIFVGEEKAISVRIEGMPDIGSPDDPE